MDEMPPVDDRMLELMGAVIYRLGRERADRQEKIDNVIGIINRWTDLKNHDTNVLNIEFAIHDLREAIGDL